MADPEDAMHPDTQHPDAIHPDTLHPDGIPPDDRPRRQPPIIEGEAVEVSVDGGPAPAGAGSSAGRRSSGFLPPRRVAFIAAACFTLAAIAVGALWVYVAADGGEAPQRNAATAGPSGRDDAAARAATVETVLPAPQVTPEKAPGKLADAKDGNTKDATNTKGLENRVAAVDGALTSLNERIGALERSVRDAASAARAAAERADRVVRQLDDAKKNGDEQEAAQQLDRGALDDLASRIKTLESRQMTVRQIQERLDRVASAAGAPDRAVRMAVAAAALRNAVERDRPFAAELAAARSTGLDDGALASLEPFAATGVPTRNELFRELSALLPELRRVSVPPSQDVGYLDRLQASAVRMLNIRPVKDEPGDDPPTVLSRIEYKMIQQDVDAIVTELDKLPAQGKELAQAWRKKALARKDAVEASRLMATGALAKLGEPATSGSSQQ
jgi:hypothetical protein